MDKVSARKIELLAPAANADVAIEAILHGADAVYIGPPSHGARKSASNSIDDIRRVADFAHPYGVKVYSTVNTIVYDNELPAVERLTWDLYRAGVDALIVQDMGLLRLDIPPIALHASTQCDTRTPEKARFLQDVGFSQIVLARELTLDEIGEICRNVDVPVEVFVHGALCVSYSGVCHASQAVMGRSANRGECAQICRLPFTLTDASGRILARDRHLLSLKDFNLSDRLDALLAAGATSFKIEGRLKDAAYVKNVVAFYRQRLDMLIEESDGKYTRSSSGSSHVTFQPRLDKSFNRGFTHYFLDSRRPQDISSPLTPKSMGEEITDVTTLNNGDGISYFNADNEYVGVMVNGIDNGRIIGHRHFTIPKGSTIHRTLDVQWQKTLARPTAVRKLWLDVTLTVGSLSAVAENGAKAIVPLEADLQEARTPRSLREAFDRFGNTIYTLREFISEPGDNVFIPASQLSDARRRLLEALAHCTRATYEFDHRHPEDAEARYPETSLDYHGNVANRLARRFYEEHGVTEIAPAMETERHDKAGMNPERRDKAGMNPERYDKAGMRSVMTTRHCILRETGRCLRLTPAAERDFRLPLTLSSGGNTFQLDFDCRCCEMHLLFAGVGHNRGGS